jgi:drug/metabolite transporter (DMT)-like permease
MLGPVVTIILAVFILSEPFGIYQFLGVSLVALGVGLLTLSPVTHKSLLMGGNERGGGVINPSLLMGENEGEEGL